MEDLFENKIIKNIVIKLSNNINYSFGLSKKEEYITIDEITKLIFAIRAELLIINSNKKDRNLVLYKKINKTFNYILELNLLESYLKNNDFTILDILFEIYIKLKNFPYVLSPKFDNYMSILERKYNKYNIDGNWMVPEQINIYKNLEEIDNLVLSVSTSFGKTFLVKKAVVADIKKNKRNIVIIAPTNALLNEYISFFKSELKNIKINIVTEIYHTVNEMSNLFVVTQEKMLGILSKHKGLVIDWIIIDEFYNLDLSDIRSQILFIVINYIYNYNNNIKSTFLVPGVKNTNEIILSKINYKLKNKSKSIYIDSSLTSRDIFFIINNTRIIKKNDILNSKINKIEEIDNTIFDNHQIKILNNITQSLLNLNQNENFLIYCPKRKIIEYANELYILLDVNLSENYEIELLLEYLIEFYGEQYQIIKFLRKGIGIHKSETDEFTRFILEEEFKNKNIKFLFCSPTLLQGVNLNTKYLFILTNKMPNSENFANIDARNLIGRIGRIDSYPHGFGFYINNKASKKIEDATLDKMDFNNEIIDNEYLESKKDKNSKDEKKEKQINIFFEKINNDKNIVFHTKYIDNNFKNNNIIPSLQDYFLEKKVDLTSIEKINKIKDCLKITLKWLFSKNRDLNIENFKEWLAKANELNSFLNMKWDIFSTNKEIDFGYMIEHYCMFLIYAINYVYNQWNDGMLYLLAITFSYYLRNFTVKTIAKLRANFFDYYNNKNTTDKYIYLAPYIIKSEKWNNLNYFNKNNDVHMTALLDNLLEMIRTEIEFNINRYISNLSSKIFTSDELIDIEKQIETLSNNEKTIFLLSLNVMRQIAITVSTEEFNDCFFSDIENKTFFESSEVISRLITKIENGPKNKHYIVIYFKKEFK